MKSELQKAKAPAMPKNENKDSPNGEKPPPSHLLPGGIMTKMTFNTFCDKSGGSVSDMLELLLRSWEGRGV